MAKHKVLSTKKLEPLLIKKASENDIEITEHEFICIKPIISKEKLTEVMPIVVSPNVHHIVFTSANGVEAVKQYLRDGATWYVPNWKIFCISGRTQDALHPYINPENIIATAEYGKDLSEKIIEHGVKEVVFFCGNKRREELPSMLQKAGVVVNEIIVYETSLTPSVVENDFDAILFFSPTAVESFFSANVPKENTVCFAIGTTTSGSLAEFTSNKIEVSEDTSQKSMLASVLSHFNNPVA